jgi:hypothetical protein
VAAVSLKSKESVGYLGFELRFGACKNGVGFPEMALWFPTLSRVKPFVRGGL